MKTLFLTESPFCYTISFNLFSQLTTSTYGGNKRAWTGERIGLTEVTIRYDKRPGVKGREGKIWGTLVKEGFLLPISVIIKRFRGAQG